MEKTIWKIIRVRGIERLELGVIYQRKKLDFGVKLKMGVGMDGSSVDL